MRISASIATGLLCLCGSARAQVTNLGGCPAPGMPGGMAWDGSSIWVADFFSTTLWQVDPATCGVIGSIQAPGRYVGGMASDGSSLWVHPEQSGQIYQLDPADGSILSVIPAPSLGDRDPNGSGLAWDGQYLWHADYTWRRIYQLDPADGTILREFPSPGVRPLGLGYHQGILVVADSFAREVYLVDVSTGAVTTSLAPPDSQPSGVAVDGAGNLLVAGWRTRSVWTLDAGLGAVTVAADLPWFENYCTSEVNYSGDAATITASGSASISANDLVLSASPVPQGRGIFLCSRSQDNRTVGFGTLCVGAPFYKILGEIDVAGTLEGRVDLTAQEGIVTGSTWCFQACFRDYRVRRSHHDEGEREHARKPEREYEGEHGKKHEREHGKKHRKKKKKRKLRKGFNFSDAVTITFVP